MRSLGSAFIPLLLIFGMGLFLPVFTDAQSEDKTLRLRNDTVWEGLIQQNYRSVARYLDSSMYEQGVDTTFLKDSWNRIRDRTDGKIERSEIQLTTVDGHPTVQQKLEGGEMPLLLRVYFNEQDSIIGIRILPDVNMSAYEDPPYTNFRKISGKNMTVQTDTFSLPAEAVYPRDTQGFPVVVLVHGSGPTDMDETVGPIKPFRDIALGLSARGVGVLRYAKRTYEYPNAFEDDSFTVWQETVNDALSAIETAKSIPGADTQRIFLIGHSLGAFLAPRIGKKAKELKGLVLLAGPARPLEDIILEQREYSMKRDTLRAFEKRMLDSTEKIVQSVKKLNERPQIPDDSVILNFPAVYWRDLNRYQPLKVAQELSMPMLILQGEHDFQVRMTDYRMWKKALSNQRMDARSFPELSHLFIKGPPLPEASSMDYYKYQPLSLKVIEDIAEWVRQQ